MKIQTELYNKILYSFPQVPPEAGGILGIKDGIVCRFFFDRGESDMQNAIYTPQVSMLNHILAEWSWEKVQFAGMVHSHLPGAETLSMADKQYIEKVLLSMPRTIRFLYFPLVFPCVKMLPFIARKSGPSVIIEGDDIILI